MTKIEEFKDAQTKYEEVVGLINEVAVNPNTFIGLEIKIGRFRGGQTPICLPYVISAVRQLLPQALDHVEIVLGQEVKNKAIAAREEAQNILDTIRGENG